jgi:hypothetical protein
MSQKQLLLAAVALCIATPSAAQLTSVPHSGEQSIVVTGERPKNVEPDIEPQMSNWRVAETAHLLVFSKGNPKELQRVADHLEKLHFLLSVLLNRVDVPDDSLKLQVTLIGDPADFGHLGLRNIRWQQGPYPKEFPNQIYYDPREDGAVMATAHADQCFMLVRDAAVMSSDDMLGVNLTPEAAANAAQAQINQMNTTVNAVSLAAGANSNHCNSNPNKVLVPAESRLYSAFTQHYLLTYFPAAYPRWYLEGFGEIFANMDADKPGVIEYGREPERYPAILDKFGHYPLQRILDDTYLHDTRWSPAFSPYSAWALAHLLFFSPQWKQPLHNYLASIAHGKSPEQSAAALGDVKKLSRQAFSYFGRNVPYERLTYPAYQFQPPNVRVLRQSEAAYVVGRLELGARVTITDGTTRQKEIAARDRWLASLRQTAASYPNELADQQLLAEAECRSGNVANCVTIADRALYLSANDPVSLTWKGYGTALQAVQAPAGERAFLLGEARATIARANHLDTESVLPLLAYDRTYSLAGEPAPDVAIDGLDKSLREVPSSPTTRLLLGSALVGDSDATDARRVLLPLAHGAFDPPEKPKAQQLLTNILAQPMAANDVPSH